MVRYGDYAPPRAMALSEFEEKIGRASCRERV